MINILPPEMKENYRYAHGNTALVRWLIIFGIGFAGLVAISATGYMYLQQMERTANSQISAAEEDLLRQNQSEIEQEVTDISDSLNLAVQVLSGEVLFSKLLQQLAVVTPSNAILTNLTITELEGGVDITAQTTDYAAATQLQVNFADPNNQIFQSADIVSITCGSGDGDGFQAQYPCTVTIRALFTDESPYLFISDGGEEQ